jgi:hypothetical protein
MNHGAAQYQQRKIRTRELHPKSSKVQELQPNCNKSMSQVGLFFLLPTTYILNYTYLKPIGYNCERKDKIFLLRVVSEFLYSNRALLVVVRLECRMLDLYQIIYYL